jgi:subtilisin-like proprotein convertase family protein
MTMRRSESTIKRLVWVCTGAVLCAVGANAAFATPLHLKLMDGDGATMSGATIIGQSEVSKPVSASVEPDGTYYLNLDGSKVSLVIQQPGVAVKQSVEFVLPDLAPGQKVVPVELRFDGQSFSPVLINNAKGLAAPIAGPANLLSLGLPTSKTPPALLGPGAGGSDACASAEAIAGSGTFNFDNSAATADGSPDALCLAFGQDNIDNDVWFCWTSDCDGLVTVQTCGLTGVDTKIAAYDGCGCPSGSGILACNDDACGGALQSSLSFTAVNGQSYLIRIGTFPGAAGGTGQFAISCQVGGGGNDDCANAEAIAGVGTFSFDNSAAITDGNPDGSCTFFGQSQIDNDVWFCWTSDCDGIVQVETCGLTGIDSKIAAYDGCTCPAGSGILACNDDSCSGTLQSRITFLAVSGNAYLIRIGTFPGEAGGTGQFAITCLGPPEPTPCTEPAANCQAGDLSDALSSLAGTFEAADDFNSPGVGSITSICWWGTYLSGVPGADNFTVTYYADAGGLPGAIIGGPFSGAGLTVTGPVDTGSLIAGVVPEFEYTGTHAAVPVTAGCFWVSVKNAIVGDNWFWEIGVGNGRAMQDGQTGGVGEPINGFDASDVVQTDLKWCLNIAVGDPSVCLPPPAANDDCANAEAIAGEGTFPFDNSAATTDGVNDPLCNFFGFQEINNDVWFCWTAPCTSDVRLETCGLTGVDTKIAVYDGCTCPTGSGILACNDDDCGLQSGLVFSAVSGQTYLIRLGVFPGAAGGVGSFSLTCVSLPDNDLCENAIGPLAVPSTTPGSTNLATTDAGFPSPCGSASITSPGVWYTVLGTGNTMTASLCNGATSYDAKLSVFCRGCGPTICVDGNDDFCGLQSQVSWCSQAGVEYLILVHGFGGATGPFELTLSDNGSPCAGPVQCIVDPTGACCSAGGACSLTTESNCDAIGGVYVGDNTDCGSETQVGSATSSPAVAIPDNNPLGVSDTLNMGASFSIQDVNISLDVTHTWVGDLIVTVEHLGTTVTIMDRPGVPASTFGCGEDNLDIVLDDEGSGGAIEAQCSPGLSSPPGYAPNNPLSAFDGLDSAGNWTITISDNAGADTGTLNSWTVTFSELGASPCGAVGACCVGATCTIESDADCATLGGVFQGDGTDCGGIVVVASPTSSPGLAIPDNNPLGVSDTIVMGMSFPISDVNIAVANTHTWVGDLAISIEHLGTTVVIVDRPGVPASTFGCSEDNWSIELDDEGTGGAIEDQCAPGLSSAPNYTPNNPLSAFDGMDSAGNWTITVSDNAGGDTGTLDSWSVIFSEPGPSPCVEGPACTPDDCPPGAFALVDNQTGEFSGWCVTTPNLPDVDIFVDTVDLANGLVVIQIVKSFRNPPDPTSGLIAPILLNFVQVCDDADTANMIVITEEAINNLTGVEWTDYHWTLFTTPVAWFDVAGSSGFNVSPFDTKQFKNFLDPPTNNKAKDLDVFGGGTVPSPGGYFPGFGTGGLKIGVDLSGSVPVSFTLKQRPTVPPPSISGACCTDGVCAISTDLDCDAAGGTFLGEDTECAACFACGVPPVTNDLCLDAIPVTVPSQNEGTTVGATPDGAPFCGTSNTAPGVWYSVTGTGNSITVTTCTECTDYDTKLSVYCTGCDLLNCVAGNDDGSPSGDNPDPACVVEETGSTFNRASTVTWCSEAGVEYLILVHGFLDSAGNFRLDVSDDGVACTTPPDCAPPPVCTPDFVVGAPGTFPGDTTGATDDCDVFFSDGADHIYEVTLPNDGLWTFTLCGSTFDTKIEVGTTCCSSDVGTNDDSDCGAGGTLQSTVTANLTAGTYFVTVDGFGGQTGAYTLDISKAAGSNDDCVDATPLSGEGEFGFDNSAASQDGPADATCTFFGQDDIDNDVWFCWTATCNGTATVETCDLTGVDTKIAAYDGCTCPPTSILACNDDVCGLRSSISFSVVSGQTYLLRIGTFPGASGGAGSFSVACTAGGLQSTPPFAAPSLDIKPGMVPNPFAKDSNGVVPVAILGTVDFDVTAVDTASIRIERMDLTGGLVAPYQGTAGPQTSIGEIGTPDGFADLSVYFETSELASALKLGELPEGATVQLLVTGSRVDGSQFKAVDSMAIAPLAKGDRFVTATSNVANVWIDASEMDINGDGGGFAGFDRCYGDQVESVTLTAPSVAENNRVFGRWLLNGVPQAPGVRSINVSLGGDQQTLEARYIRPRPISPGAEIRPGQVGSTDPLP